MFLLNNKIKFEGEEIRNLFYIKDKEREIPLYIQNVIIDLIFNELDLVRTNEDINESLKQIDKRIIYKVADCINNMYRNNGKTEYEDKHIVYLWYYLPNNIYKIWQPLVDLAVAGELKTEINILDIGTGPGSLPIGVVEFYSKIAETFKDINFKLNISLVDEQKKFLQYAEYILSRVKKEIPNNLEIYFEKHNFRITNKTIFNFNKKFDLISMSNFLNHFEHKSVLEMNEFIENLKPLLTEDGSIIVIEPGSKDECEDLKEIRNQLINRGKYNLFSPCIPLWHDDKTYNCKCFTSYSMPIKKPKIIKFLNDYGLNKGKTYVSFNYMVLRTDGLRKYKVERNKQSYYLISELYSLIDGQSRLNIKGIVRKKSLSNRSFCVCDGTCIARDIWINIDYDADYLIEEFNKLNMGEKVNLKGIKIIKQGDSIRMFLDKKSKLEVFY